MTGSKAFGIFDYTMIPKLRSLLKPFGLRLVVRSNTRQWGDQVEVTVEYESATAEADFLYRVLEVIEKGVNPDSAKLRQLRIMTDGELARIGQERRR